MYRIYESISLTDIYKCIAYNRTPIVPLDRAREMRSKAPARLVSPEGRKMLVPKLIDPDGRLKDNSILSTIPLSEGLKNSELIQKEFSEGLLLQIDFRDLYMIECEFKGTRLVGCDFSKGLFDGIHFTNRSSVSAAVTAPYPHWSFWGKMVPFLIGFALFCVWFNFTLLIVLLVFVCLMFFVSPRDNRIMKLFNDIIRWYKKKNKRVILLELKQAREQCSKCETSTNCKDCHKHISCKKLADRQTLVWRLKSPQNKKRRDNRWDQYAKGFFIDHEQSWFKNIALNSMARMRNFTFDKCNSPTFENYVRHQMVCDERWHTISVSRDNQFIKFLRYVGLVLIAMSIDSGRSFCRLMGITFLLILAFGGALYFYSDLSYPTSMPEKSEQIEKHNLFVKNSAENTASTIAVTANVNAAAGVVATAVASSTDSAVAAESPVAKPLMTFKKPPEDQLHASLVTPFYYAMVTVTTLGYGDITPINACAQLFSILLVLVGYSLLGLLLCVVFARVKP